MGSADERRKFNRVNNEFNVRLAKELRKKNYRDITIDIGKSLNVSASGLLVNVKEKIDIGSTLRITFLKPNTFEFFEGFGKTVRIEDNSDGTYAIGVEFMNLNEDEKKRLNYYLTLLKK